MCDEGLLLQYSRTGKVQNYLNKLYQVAETLTMAGSNQRSDLEPYLGQRFPAALVKR
jgi:hypothetical protein